MSGREAPGKAQASWDRTNLKAFLELRVPAPRVNDRLIAVSGAPLREALAMLGKRCAGARASAALA